MKYVYLTTLMASCTLCLFAQKVQKVTPNSLQDFGITYYLPKTNVGFVIDATCTSIEAGPYALYAEKYLGINDASLEDNVTWQINKVSIEALPVIDNDCSYHISFSEKGALPIFYLNDKGCLLSINMEPSLDASADVDALAPKTESAAVPVASVMNEELLKAGSKAKQAEIAARQIFRIRESRLNLLTGEVDNLPADGASFQLVLDNLQAQEAAYMALFVGKKSVKTIQKTYSCAVTDNVKDMTVFRFSTSLGLVDADDLCGEPYVAQIQITEDNRISSDNASEDAKDARSAIFFDKKKKGEQGIAFTLPGKAHVELSHKGARVAVCEMHMGQLGHIEQLPISQFTDKKVVSKAKFNPNTGAIEIYEQK